MSTKTLFFFVLLLVLLSVAGRFLPHPANFTPMGALALFSGTYLFSKTRYAIFLPLVVMFVSDIFLGFYEPGVMVSVYGSFLAIVLVGRLVSRHKNIFTILTGTLAGSALFYLTTNFAVWALSPLYPQTLTGLMTSYVAALPFFRYMLLGDLFYVTLFFGAYESMLALAKVRLFNKPKKFSETLASGRSGQHVI